MNFVAIKMLVGDRAKYLGIIMGLTFASLLITQQAAIFCGLMTRTFNAVNDLALPDIWVVDPKVQFIDDIKPLQDTEVNRVHGVAGVQWAVPLYKGLLSARLDNGSFQTCNVLGLDDETLVGGPPEMVEGKLSDLHRADAVIVDIYGATTKLAHVPLDAAGNPIPGARTIPLKVGEAMELNDHRAVVVGICRVSRTFQSQPVIYTTYTRATTFAPSQRKLLSFVLVKAKPGVSIPELCQRINRLTGLSAYSKGDFKLLTLKYYMNNTGIPINFGIAVVLGFVVGTAIAGQTFYNFTLDNLRHFGALKAMGAPDFMLLKMIVLQSAMTGAIGYGLGVGAASFIGWLASGGELAFMLPWQLLCLSGGAVVVICLLAALISIHKVMRLEPAIVFKG